MNRVRDEFLNCIFYVYPCLQEAQEGKRSGGSGFLAHVPLENNGDRCVIYALTNSHVIKKSGEKPAIAINRKDGKREIFMTNNSDWIFLPNHDVAAVPVGIDSSGYLISHIPLANFVTEEIISKQEIGPGDETFMVGRFINHEGTEKNCQQSDSGIFQCYLWSQLKMNTASNKRVF